ncbi:BREX-1 system adenine-specific DNA-methyltransferase PglX [Pseudoalteromonas sp. MEBiC 03485]|uniref:BREX-1 system adenine-specific DNA-methyltransferase PglX n=1 Tax=Pseudoalteromonas sp. MEBiC 03485 TaxID=2571103 RepID=UPI00101F3394|nr:BREX-1 system adenine-specific DNA-methyltransferase PglX [Pseudoalteromonas sp. MEBiC 03485]RZD20081.1 BREX-1 system adenine-specific DNA-methyltransferase PglX [Pseudoalteromonas sp. MEBiC 03485]
MNTKNLKAYAPKARREFIAAVKKRAAHFGIYEDRIEEVRIEGGAAIIEGRAFTRKEGEQRKRLESKIAERASATYKEKYDMFVREMAYTWFNRLAAIRYMELHDYFDHGFRVLSNPSNPDGLPEILSHASDVADSLDLEKSHIIELQLAGDKEEELYRELLLGQCHQLAKIMPQIFKGLGFEALDDATELLLPNNLTKTDSILKGLINDIPEEDWQQIEVIGWLYQFYISEHKDAVIGKVVKSEDIPAATQLFTPNWIVKYLVQNSVGRQWLATYPDSELKGKMEYYIEPAEQSEEVIEQLKAITPTSIDPEEIKVLDPACGSGHILVEVYEVLREIYLERGYRLREIPELILTKNIYGLDIDDRAAQLAGFALMMKAREDDRRIFQRVEEGEVALNLFSLQSTEHLDIPKLWKALDLEGNQQIGSTGGLFDEEPRHPELDSGSEYGKYFELLQELKTAFLQAKTLGSLIQIDVEHLDNLLSLKQLLLEKFANSDTQSKPEVEKVLPIVNQAIVLAQRYDALVANPPYLGSKGMNASLKEHAKKAFPNSKSDLFAVFMERAFGLLTKNGYNAQVNMQSWMFLSSYESLRDWLLDTKTFVTMAHLGARAFGQISGEVVQTTAWILNNVRYESYQPVFFRLIEGNETEKRTALAKKENSYNEAMQSDFKKIPGSPIAYWLAPDVFNAIVASGRASSKANSRAGMTSGNNDYFTRYWYEINGSDFSDSQGSWEEAIDSGFKWFPYNKGGSYKKWFGNINLVIRYDEQYRNKLKVTGNNCASEECYFQEGLTWTDLTSGRLGARFLEKGAIFDIAGHCAYPVEPNGHLLCLGLMNTNFINDLSKVINATMHFQPGDFRKLPFPNCLDEKRVIELVKSAVSLTKNDWDEKEYSWRFKRNLLIGKKPNLIKDSYLHYLQESISISSDLKVIESELNQMFIKAFELDDTYSYDVPIEQITLEKNPHYSFKGDKEKFLSVIISELISYCTGCVMGRYSLDREGIIYAHSGNEGFKQLEAEGAYKTFPADDDGIIPLASEEWLFDDDATTRFREFVKTVWGGEHLNENLEFVAESLCLHTLKPLSTKKGGGESAMDIIRRYFSTQFFKDHCKTYKKRPIYWLFSSGKEKAFECLVYLHRYNEGTLSRMRTEYVTPLMGKYDAQLARLSDDIVNATGSEARRIEKDIKALEKKQAELRTFDEQLKHYAEKRITLDLDDGVKENYGKFGNLLADVKNIHGKAVK